MPVEAPVEALAPVIDAEDLMKDASVTTESPMKATVTTPSTLRTGHAAQQPPVVRTPKAAAVAQSARVASEQPSETNPSPSATQQEDPPVPRPSPRTLSARPIEAVPAHSPDGRNDSG